MPPPRQTPEIIVQYEPDAARMVQALLIVLRHAPLLPPPPAAGELPSPPEPPRRQPSRRLVRELRRRLPKP